MSTQKTIYPLAVSSWGQEELDAIQDVIKSNNFTMGAKVQEFEQAFASWCGSKYCVMVNSGSSANLLMIAAMIYFGYLKRGDEVIVPAVSWATTYHPLEQHGLRIKFVDIDIETLNFNLSALRKAVTKKTKAILAVNLLGNPNDFKKIEDILIEKDSKAFFLEDNCESCGAVYESKQCGTFGLMGTFSTFFSHHFSTMEGGMIVTDDKILYQMLLSLRAHGWTRNLPATNLVEGSYEKDPDPFIESFKFVLPGYNVRPLEIEAAVGLEQLKKLNGFIAQRRNNAQYFQEKIVEKYKDYFWFQKEVGMSSWFGFSIILKDKSNKKIRKKIIKVLTENNIETRPIVAGNFVKNPVVKNFYSNYKVCGKLKNANHLDKFGFYIGNHQIDIKEMIDILDYALSKCVTLL